MTTIQYQNAGEVCKVWGPPTFWVLADIYWAGMLTSQWSCLPEHFPVYRELKIAWHAKITLLIIKFSRSINQIPGDFQTVANILLLSHDAATNLKQSTNVFPDKISPGRFPDSWQIRDILRFSGREWACVVRRDWTIHRQKHTCSPITSLPSSAPLPGYDDKSLLTGLKVNDGRCVDGITSYAQQPYGTRGTNHLQFWKSWGPSVFGPLWLLQLCVVYSVGSVGRLQCFPRPPSRI